MKQLFQKLFSSFDNHSEGFSARKLSAFASVVTAMYITKYKLPPDQQINALYAWIAFALLCLGIVTIEQVLKFKNGDKKE